MPRRNIGDTPAKHFAELLSGPMIDIIVGKEAKQWSLHRNLLCHHSSFFNEDLSINGEPRRIKGGVLELPDADVGAFELLVKWLYQGTIQDVSSIPKEQKWDYAFACQNLYLLCETLGLRELQNLAIDQFRKGCYESELVPGPEEMLPIYRNTHLKSPFRRLVSSIAARQIMDPGSKRDASAYRTCFEASPDFAVDVINFIREQTGGELFDDPTAGSSCRYHEHSDGEYCHKTVKFKEGT